MAVTFKRFQSNERLSEETIAYATDVLFNGQKIGTCTNRGQGGQGIFHKDEKVGWDVVEEANAWAKGQPTKDVHGRQVVLDSGQALVSDNLEDYCDDVASLLHVNKVEAARLKRLMKANTVFLDPAEPGDLFQLKNASHSPEQMKAAVEKRYPGAVVLNGLGIEDALKRVREADLLKETQAKPAPAKKPKGP